MTELRFGVQWAPALGPQDLAQLAQDLEGLGYFSIGFPDHYFVGKGPDYTPLHEPFSALGFVAGVTSTIRLVSIVADNDFRHPALFARTTATLDILSGGRLEAGLGAGWFDPEYAAIGLGFDPAGTRIERLDEAVQVIRSLWTSDRTIFEGKHYRLSDAPGLPKPVQKPHPPILIGAGGPKMLRLAGRHADVIGLTTSLRDYRDRKAMFAEMMPASVANKIEIAKQAASDAGRDLGDLTFQCQLDKIEFEGEDAGHLWALMGEPEKMIDELHARAELGITYFMLRERRIDRLREFGEKVVSKI